MIQTIQHGEKHFAIFTKVLRNQKLQSSLKVPSSSAHVASQMSYEGVAGGTQIVLVFSDEKIFTIKPTVNPQNDRILEADKQIISRGEVVGKTAHPSSVMD